MQYKITFMRYSYKSATYNVPLLINQYLNSAQTPADILQVIVDNETELSNLNNQHSKYYCRLSDIYDSETVAELMSDVLTSKGINHSLRIAEDIEEGNEVLYYVEVDGIAYHFPFEKEPYDEEAENKKVEEYLASKKENILYE